MIPSVKFQRLDGNTGVVRPSATGVLAIIAACQQGTLNQASTWNRSDLVASNFGAGPLPEDAAYTMSVSGNPVLLVGCAATTVGAYGTVQQLYNGGTSIATAGGTAPLDEYNVLVTIVTGGTRGVSGITYTYSLDGGAVTSGVTALGTATSIVIPNTGVTIALAAGTLVAGEQIQVFTTRPQPNSADITAALEALRVSNQPWDSVFIDVDASAAMVTQLDAWLASLEAVGQFHLGFLNTRHKLTPVTWVPNELPFASSLAAPAETETTFGNAFGAFATVSSIRVSVGSDAGDVVSLQTGYTQPRPTALLTAARAMSIPVGTDPAFVALGNLTNVQLSDANGNPKWHDEMLYSTLDSQRFTTLRSYPGEQGAFVTNANIFSPSGSDYVYVQQGRVMNVAMTVAFQLLTFELSKGIGKQAPAQNGAIYILEKDAAAIEGFVNLQLVKALKGQVQAVALVISRTDDIGSNAGAVINAQLEVETLAYIKQFAVISKFVRSIQVQA